MPAEAVSLRISIYNPSISQSEFRDHASQRGDSVSALLMAIFRAKGLAPIRVFESMRSAVSQGNGCGVAAADFGLPAFEGIIYWENPLSDLMRVHVGIRAGSISSARIYGGASGCVAAAEDACHRRLWSHISALYDTELERSGSVYSSSGHMAIGSDAVVALAVATRDAWNIDGIHGESAPA